MEKKGILYLIATPIGNLEDMTLRGIRTLKEVNWIAAEDTRHTRQLLNHFEIKGNLIRYDEHTKETAGKELLVKLEAGESIGLVSDAGMPGIADPGVHLAQQAIQAGITVMPLPGANAGLTALIASGLPTETFYFAGFLPRTEKKQKEELQNLRALECTLILYEAPHRLKKTLVACLEALGNRQAAWGRELTKKFETFERGTLKELLEQAQNVEPRGEYVLLIAGNTGDAETEEPAMIEPPEKRLWALISAGESKKEAARKVAKEYNLSRREVYSWTVEE